MMLLLLRIGVFLLLQDSGTAKSIPVSLLKDRNFDKFRKKFETGRAGHKLQRSCHMPNLVEGDGWQNLVFQ